MSDYRDSEAQKLEERLTAFGARIIKLSAKLSRSATVRHVALQIVRSGTSAAPNYAEARAAESRADFIHKMKIVHKELNETVVWLRMLTQTETISVQSLTPLLTENEELCRIIGASLQTLRKPNRKSEI